VYVLWVRGNGEDAATILRRLMEIAFQVKGLSMADNQQRDERGTNYLAYFWYVVKEITKDIDNFSQDNRDYIERMYKQHKHLLIKDKNGRILDWWGGGGICELAKKVGCKDAYDKDYRLLSKMSHCTSAGILYHENGNTIHLRSNEYDPRMEAILVFASYYMVFITNTWNETFRLLNSDNLNDLVNKCENKCMELKTQGGMH
jgi:hypothetical protein